MSPQSIPSIMLMIMISLTHTLMAKFMFMLTLMQGSKQSKPSMPPFSLLLPLDHRQSLFAHIG